MFRDIGGNKFTNNWIAEFCGFFWGEGYIGIIPYIKWKNGRKYKFYRGHVSIQLRDDDIKILQEIQNKLGGHIWKAKPRKILFQNGKTYLQNQTYGWIATGRKDLQRIMKALERGNLPSKKKKNVKYLKKYLKISANIRNNNIIKQEIEELIAKCKENNSRGYKVTD